MADEKNDPLDDVRKGLGLLFRAARTAASKLAAEGAPLDKIEAAVKSGAREVGRALENVTNTVASGVRRASDPPEAKGEASGSEEVRAQDAHEIAAAAEAAGDKSASAKDGEKKAAEGAPKSGSVRPKV